MKRQAYVKITLPTHSLTAERFQSQRVSEMFAPSTHTHTHLHEIHVQLAFIPSYQLDIVIQKKIILTQISLDP